MNGWSKILAVLALVAVILGYDVMFRADILNSATSTYYFTLDSTSVNLGIDGRTNTSTSLNAKISMKTGVYTYSRSVVAASNTTEQSMLRVYGPAFSTKQTVTAPSVTIGVRDRNGTTNSITWKAEVYDYNPSGTTNNGVLLWTSNAVEAHPAVQTPLELPFTNPLPKDIDAGHRLKVVIKCQMASTASSARLYWGGSTNYSFFTVTAANYVANSLTVTNLSDYYNGQLTSVTQGDKTVAMLKYDMYTNVAGGATWTGGLLDKIGSNTSVYLNPDEPGDVSFSIYKDADGDGLFEITDTLIGGPYNFTQLTGQTYALTTPQTITATPQRYFIVYNILRTANPSTTVGARIVDGSYFTVTGAAGGVQNVTSTSSSTPTIQYGGVAITKVYRADWDSGTSLAGISETGATQPSPNATDSACIARNTAGSAFPLTGLLNYPAHICTSVAGQGYSTTTAQSDFIRLYFGGTGYASAMKTIKGTSFTYRVATPSGGGTVTLRLFYVTPGGVRVNAPISSTYRTTSSVNIATTTSLAGQDFSDVPAGSRLGIQIGVTANVRIGLGGANGMSGSSSGANLTVQETAAENENVDVGNGVSIPNANVYASDTGIPLDAFTLNSAKPKTVTGITLTGNALFNSTNIKNLRLYADSGTLGIVDGETPLATVSGSSISGNSVSFTGLSLNITPTVRRYLVTVDIGDTPNVNVILKALVSGVTVATTGTTGENTDSSSATLTIEPTTTLTDGAAEPPTTIINAGAGATKIDAFGIRTNGGLNDQINTTTVTLSTTSALPAEHVVSDYVARVEIVNSANTVVYGYLTSPTTGDTWQIATTNLYATSVTTECYVRITPKANLGGTYAVTASVTGLTHLRTINRLLVGDDDTSAAVTIDGAPPANPANFTSTTGPSGKDINLNWDPSTDASGSAVTYTLVRGLGNAPAPQTCTPVAGKVFLVYQGSDPAGNPDVYDTGLEEGQAYSYRLCATDAVGNRSLGVTATTTAGIVNRCNLAPTLTVNPSASYVKAGQTVQFTVAVINNDTGVCGSASTFHLSTVGTPNTTDFDPVSFSANDFTLPTNGGSNYLKLSITAKAGAPQSATNAFSVRVDKSGASVATVQYPNPVDVVVDKYGSMMHSSLQLGTNKFGQWGLDYTCATCHSPSATNIKQVKNVITTPTGDRPVIFTTISTSESITSGVMGNDKRTGTTSTNVCEVCHHNARFHQYTSSKVAWNTHNNSSDCMRCHDHRIGFKTLADGASCDDCHGNPPGGKAQLVIPPTNVLYPYVTGDDAGAHPKHSSRKLACQTCHSNANHLITAQPNTKLNMGFSIRSSNFPGFQGNIAVGTLKSVTPANGYVYESAAGTTVDPAFDKIMTCSVYCHGYWNGSYAISSGYNTEPAWSGTTQTGCGSCHAATGWTPPPTGSHAKHAGTLQGYGNGIACTTCHGFRNYTTSAAHINGSVEWDLSAITTNAHYKDQNKGSTGALAPSDPASYGHCDNLYCHSNVQSPPAVTGGSTGPANRFGSPTWGTSTTCGSCHDEPNTSGGHTQHVAPGVTGFDCRICHGSGGDANSLNHANGKINFLFGGLGENTHYSYSSVKIPGSGPYGNCSNSDCHGRRTITWGAPTAIPLCNKCHATEVSSGFYGTAGPASTTSNTDPYVGAHFQHITSMPFKFSNRLDCSQCHLKPTGPYSPGHIDTALPAEINFGSLATSGAQNGYSSVQHQPSYNYATKQCSNVWCHGAGMNSNQGTGPYGSIGPVEQGLDGGTLGAPDAKSATWNTPYLATAADKCQTCHASPPPAPESGYEHFDDDTGAPYARNKCTNCHRHLNATGDGFSDPTKHVNGLIDSCRTCHGRPPIDDETLTRPAIGALSDGMVGAHQAHRLNPAIGNDCSACHYNYTYDMPSYRLEIGFRAYGGRITKGVFYGMSTLPSSGYSKEIVYFSTWTSTKVRRTTDSTKVNTCENIYCHGGGTNTLPPLGGGSNNKPNWEAGPSQAVCGSCHGVTGETYRSRGSHGAHVGTGFLEPKLGCYNCHGIKENNYHVDGKVEWDFYSTAKRLNQLPGYSGTGYKPPGASSYEMTGFVSNLAPSPSYGTCQVYCHSDVYDKTFKVPTWGGAAMTCGSCHRNQTSTFSGSHQKHSASSVNGGYGIDCMICHYGSGAGNPLHVNGSVEVIFNPAVVGASATYASGSKQCFSILCHNTTSSTGPTWGNSATGNYDTGTYKPTCIGCHSGDVGARAAIIPQFAGASHHFQGAEINSLICYSCHMEANADGTANTSYHDRASGKTVDLVIWGAGSRGAVFTRYTANGNTTRKRTEYQKVSNQCIGCHRTRNNTTQPFATAGDNRTPSAYSWDTYSIYARYSTATTTLWGKVTANNTLTKSLTKAYSAHGRADLNQRGWTPGDPSNGETYTNTSGTVKVVCFDCHNSHGSYASGIMTSYSSATGRYQGGILKSTSAGLGGYGVAYTPSAGGDPAPPNKNAYNAGAALCHDCHNTPTANSTTPWGYNATFGSTQPIYGYHDKPYFGDYSSFGTARTASYKAMNATNKGGHFGHYTTLATTPTRRINGLCTPCHDPHGVSPSLGANQQYAVPLLKGTWVTSPYKQDAAPGAINETRGGGREEPAINVGSTPGYHIDQNTMGLVSGGSRSNWTFPNNGSGQTPTTMQTVTEAQFAGLCLGCHNKADLQNTASASTSNWKTMKRIHNTVDGWATATGGNANNSKHAFTCSKCHTSHNAGLPRLLVTNCLNVNHRGRVVSGGSMSAPNYINGRKGDGAGRFPQGGGGTGDSPKTSAGKWFFGKATQSTAIADTSQTMCHESATAGGTYNGGMEQKWNNVTPW